MKSKVLFLVLLLLSFPFYAQCQSREGRIDSVMARYYAVDKFMGVVLVAENGNILAEKGFGYSNLEWAIPSSPEQHFVIASITKTFAAVVTLRLIQDGKLRLENTISDFLPYYRKDVGTMVTIHHLLTNSSGIPNFIQKPGFMQNSLRRHVTSYRDFILEFCSDSLEFSPGSRFRYNNSGFVILGAIIEKVSGMSFGEVLRKYVLDPAGMQETGVNRNDLVLSKRVAGYDRTPDGGFENAGFWDYSWAFSAGSLYSTARDLYMFIQALSGGRLLAEDLKQKMFTPYFPAFGYAQYGYGLTIGKLPVGTKGDSATFYGHEGGILGFNTWMIHLPERNRVIILLNNTSNCPLREISSALLSVLEDKEFITPKASVATLVYQGFKKNGKESAQALFLEAKRTNSMEAGWRELNTLGYTLLRRGDTTDAVTMFELNAEAYPENWNVHNSLGEGYAAIGSKEKAISSYQTALKLNPKSESIRRQLEILAH
jgi:CubicO group peptidase (beta-lactamase class C family)